MKLNESHWQTINNYPNSLAKNSKSNNLSFIKDTKSKDRFIKKMKLSKIKTEGEAQDKESNNTEDIKSLLPKFIIKNISQAKYNNILETLQENKDKNKTIKELCDIIYKDETVSDNELENKKEEENNNRENEENNNEKDEEENEEENGQEELAFGEE